MPVEDEFKKGHKFPFTVSEILNCDNQKILDYFLSYDDFTNVTNKAKKEEKKERYDDDEFVEVMEAEDDNKHEQDVDIYEDINKFDGDQSAQSGNIINIK